jgi:hypothetical protein
LPAGALLPPIRACSITKAPSRAIGARTDPEEAYDIDIETEHETAQKANIFRQLKISRRKQPLEPLLKGGWR